MKLLERKLFNNFCKRFENSQDIPILVLVPTDERMHPVNSPLAFVGVYILGQEEVVGLPVRHVEADKAIRFSYADINKFLEILSGVFLPDAKSVPSYLKLPTTYDVNSIEYIKKFLVTPKEQFYPKVMKDTHNRLHDNIHANLAIPLSALLKYTYQYGKHLESVLEYSKEMNNPTPYEMLNDKAIPSLRKIEQAGLKVDEKILREHFDIKDSRFVDEFVYSQYNLFTTTGRPSCAFGGINFGALNKQDGSRKPFISRFENGKLILLDYESFHLRLIAPLIGYDLPKDIPAHEYFGRQYFSTKKCTEKQYEESKRRSFYQLYGEAEPELSFFKKVHEYRQQIWSSLRGAGFIVSPIAGRKIYLDRIFDPSPSKVFNYLIQLYETEHNMWTLPNMWKVLENKESKIILYNYDSFLIDYSPSDGVEVIDEIVGVVELDDEYPIRVYEGNNFHELKQLR